MHWQLEKKNLQNLWANVIQSWPKTFLDKGESIFFEWRAMPFFLKKGWFMNRTSGLIVNQTWHGSSLGEHGIHFFFFFTNEWRFFLFFYSQLTYWCNHSYAQDGKCFSGEQCDPQASHCDLSFCDCADVKLTYCIIKISHNCNTY